MCSHTWSFVILSRVISTQSHEDMRESLWNDIHILSYCPRTTANKLSHNSSNISERRGIMESYRLLHRYFHKVHNVTVDTVFHTWVARICLRGCWKGETDIRCLLATVLASIASSASYNKRLEWRTPHTADPHENRQPTLIVRNKERTLFHTCWAIEYYS